MMADKVAWTDAHRLHHGMHHRRIIQLAWLSYGSKRIAVSWNIDCNGAVAEVAEMGSTASHIEAVSEVA